MGGIVSGDDIELPFIPVIIIQSHWIGMWRVVDELTSAGFNRNVDFRSSITSLGVEDYIIPGKSQLLVTDSFEDAPGAVSIFVRKMRLKNPELETAYFSPLKFFTGDVSGFHQTIPTANYPVLVETVRSFLKSYSD
jgi:hypothetical protein